MSDGAHKRTRTCAVPEQTCAVTEAATATRNDNKVFGYRRETSDMMVTPVLRFNGTFTVDQEIAILTWLSLADVGAYALTCSDATRMAYLHLKHATHMVVEHPEIKATDDTQSSVCTHVYRWACHAATQHCAQLRIITINKYVIACRHCTPSRMRRLLLKLIHGSMQTLENVEAYPEYSTFAIALATTKCRRLQRYFGPHHYSEGNATAAEHTGMTHYLELLSANCRSITDVQFSTPDINRLRDSISQSTSIVTYTALERYLKGFPFIHVRYIPRARLSQTSFFFFFFFFLQYHSHLYTAVLFRVACTICTIHMCVTVFRHQPYDMVCLCVCVEVIAFFNVCNV
jgi:hypothetical protein